MKKPIEDLDSIPDLFTDGVRGLMLLWRTKDGAQGNSQRKAIKRISHNTDDWKETVRELSYIQQDSHHGYRIYSSINKRDMQKAIHEFKRRQLEIDFGDVYAHELFYRDIKNRFFSCLMNPNARIQNNFLVDCDTKKEYEYAKLELRDSGLIIWEYATKNGWHIITAPFNPNDYRAMQIKKDELMFIG